MEWCKVKRIPKLDRKYVATKIWGILNIFRELCLNALQFLFYFTLKVEWENSKAGHSCFLFGKSFFQTFSHLSKYQLPNTRDSRDWYIYLNATYYQRRFQKPGIWTLKSLTLVSMISICWFFLIFKSIVRHILANYLTNNTE